MGCLLEEEHMAMSKLLGVDIWSSLSEREKSFIKRSEAAYHKAIERKMEDVKKSGAKVVMTACPVCIATIARGAKLYGVNVEVDHLVNLVAKALE